VQDNVPRIVNDPLIHGEGPAPSRMRLARAASKSSYFVTEPVEVNLKAPKSPPAPGGVPGAARIFPVTVAVEVPAAAANLSVPPSTVWVTVPPIDPVVFEMHEWLLDDATAEE
jgi:hypothetical protein